MQLRHILKKWLHHSLLAPAAIFGSALLIFPFSSRAGMAFVSQDASVYQFTGASLGSGLSSTLYAINDSTAAGPAAGEGHNFVSYIDFDLSHLGATTSGELLTTTLYFYTKINPFGAAPGSLTLENLTESWLAPSVTWDDPLSTGAWTASITLSGGAGTWIGLDITSIVGRWLDNPGTQFGFKLTSGDGSLSFHSNDSTGGNAGFRPFIAMAPEPSRALLIFAGLGLALTRRQRRLD
jgi:hypothetical protein